jgi:hypothetical protein
MIPSSTDQALFTVNPLATEKLVCVQTTLTPSLSGVKFQNFCKTWNSTDGLLQRFDVRLHEPDDVSGDRVHARKLVAGDSRARYWGNSENTRGLSP